MPLNAMPKVSSGSDIMTDDRGETKTFPRPPGMPSDKATVSKGAASMPNTRHLPTRRASNAGSGGSTNRTA